MRQLVSNETFLHFTSKYAQFKPSFPVERAKDIGFSTPAGTYAYRLTAELTSKIGRNYDLQGRWAHIFRPGPSCRILDVVSYSEQQYRRDLDALGIEPSDVVDPDDWGEDAFEALNFERWKPFEKIYQATKGAARYGTGTIDRLAWSTLLQQAGYDAIIDDAGLMHPDHPDGQVVFFPGAPLSHIVSYDLEGPR